MSLNRSLIKTKSILRVQVTAGDNLLASCINPILIERRRVHVLASFQFIRSRKSFGSFVKFVATIILTILCMLLTVYKLIQHNNNPLAITQNFIYIEPINSFYRRSHDFSVKIDYHDYEYLEKEKKRHGLPGENGQPVYADKDEEALNKELFDANGYYGLVSDKVALNRSVADFRHDQCAKLRYLKDLPSVSIVIPFYNDHLSTLLRTVYSVINRAPAHLLKEVVLVNDHSTKAFLYDDLEEHIKSHEHLKHKVKLLVLPRRSGLIWARLAGARAASGDVLIFLDSHTEASTNFLPPLIEPIALDYRTCVCPFIDVIDFKTFQYKPQGDGARGVFDWRLSYHSIPLREGDQKHKWSMYENPVMVGGLFAISAKFFWELGGYDPGLDIWGGEQFELSFKIWLCGGKMYDTPCSRIGHVYRGSMPFPNDRKGIDFISINLKRVAEVWMVSAQHPSACISQSSKPNF
jgi:polypeptide N-acetylgalactosaminyltransferase